MGLSNLKKNLIQPAIKLKGACLHRNPYILPTGVKFNDAFPC